jgi:NADH-quinone oxidoreductase subunit E
MKSTRTIDEELGRIETILERYPKGRESLLAVLQDIQIEYNYLPRHALILVAERLWLPVSTVYRVATFYNAFSLKPRGKHMVTVCLGTACHVKGGPRILESLERHLNIREGETTPDRKFSLESVRCIGCCGLAPVITIGDDLYGKVTQAQLPKILKKYTDGGA